MTTAKLPTPYDDIINLPHPTSLRHPRMPISERAGQFSPFAALTDHDSHDDPHATPDIPDLLISSAGDRD